MSTEYSETYIYHNLPSRYIRVLELHPAASPDVELRCRLVPQKIEDVPYEALSYVWGKPTVFHSSIYCVPGSEDEPRGGKIAIGANLMKALVAYRLADKPRRIWADAICINQQDLAERQAQVRMMGAIFKGAERVLCWLGGFKDPLLDEPAAMLAIRFLKQFNRDPDEELRRIQNCLHHHHDHSAESGGDELLRMSWLAVKILFDVEYFQRAWIIQEIGLAQHAELAWGKSDVCVPWPEVDFFSEYMDAKGASVVNHFDLKSWVCHHIQMVWLRKPDGQPVYDFNMVLHWARTHISTDPRDYVYAHLGHPSAMVGGELIIEPSYTIPAEEMYTTLATNLIVRTESADILAFVDHGDEFGTTSIPTWVPDWRAPNLVAPIRYPTHAASKLSTGIGVGSDARTFLCQGFVLDRIVGISDMIIPKDLNATTYKAETRKKVPFLFDHIYQRLVNQPGLPLASWKQFVQSLSTVLPGGYRGDADATAGDVMYQQQADCAAYILSFEKIKHGTSHAGLLQEMDPEEMAEFKQLALAGSAVQFRQDITWTSMCRKVFRTSKGNIGLGPRVMRVDDVCAVVPGSVFPLVLRKKGEHYQLVGAALLHGFMDHEAENRGHELGLTKEEICII